MLFKDKVLQQYQGAAGRNYHATLNFVPDAAYPWVARMRRSKLAPYINTQDTVLEYGAGTGWNLAALNCRRRLGYDIGAHLAPLLNRHDITYIDNIQDIADASIDVVICHHVLEHTPEPPHVLARIRRILRPDGKLLLYVPYEIETRYRRHNPREPNLHLYSWNAQTLGNLVVKMDFNLIQASVARFGYDRFAAVWAYRLRLGESGYRVLLRLAHLVKPALEVTVVAQKPLN